MKMTCRKDLYKGIHYHCDRDNHLKQELVRLKRLKIDGKPNYVLQVGTRIRTFKEEEFCFCELDEKGLSVVKEKRKSPFVLLRQQTTKQEVYQNFLCLTIVFNIVGDGKSNEMFLGSNRIKLFDVIEPGKACALKKLGKKLKVCFGDIINQWFMYDVGDNNNEQPVRVILRKDNFSVLDYKLNVLHFHRLHNIEVKDCRVNPLMRLFQMEIVENSPCQRYQQVHSIRLRSSMTGNDVGYSFRTDLCGQLHEIHQYEQCDIKMSQTPDEKILNWLVNLECPKNNPDISDSLVSTEENTDVTMQEISEYTVDTLPVPCPCAAKVPCEINWEDQCQQVGQSGTSIVENPPSCNLRPPRGHLIRADSVDEICFREPLRECQCNGDESKRSSGTSCDDSEYQRIYYKNLGWVKCCRRKVLMSHRIRRQKHLDLNITGVDFSVINKHEEWWDGGFKMRSKDQIYTRTKKEWTSCKRRFQQPENEDMYWNGDLCLTIQLMMEKKGPKLLDHLDLTWSQMCAVIIFLSLDQYHGGFKKDWRDFAELLGLRFGDIEIIQYFCYAQREWPARVVLSHWKFLSGKYNYVPSFDLNNFRFLLTQIGRRDILKIVNCSDTNCFENTEQEKCSEF